jgi:hypothetical protein
MARFAICYRSTTKDETMAVHAAGCSDIERNEKRRWGANVSIVESNVTTEIEIAGLALDEELREMGYDDSHVRVFPCCKAVR